MLADIGNGTVNIMKISNCKPITTQSYTEKMGVNNHVGDDSRVMSASHDDQNGYRVPFYRYEYFYYIMFLHKSKDGILPVRIAGKIPFLFLNLC